MLSQTIASLASNPHTHFHLLPELNTFQQLWRDFDTLRAVRRGALQAGERWTSIKQELAKKDAPVHEEPLETYIELVETGRLLGLPLTLVTLNLPLSCGHSKSYCVDLLTSSSSNASRRKGRNHFEASKIGVLRLILRDPKPKSHCQCKNKYQRRQVEEGEHME